MQYINKVYSFSYVRVSCSVFIEMNSSNHDDTTTLTINSVQVCDGNQCVFSVSTAIATTIQ